MVELFPKRFHDADLSLMLLLHCSNQNARETLFECYCLPILFDQRSSPRLSKIDLNLLSQRCDAAMIHHEKWQFYRCLNIILHSVTTQSYLFF